MSINKYPPDFIKLLHSVKAKRPRTVIEHILKHGQISTEELKDIYGYNHPPRAIRDVREHGIPVHSVLQAVMGVKLQPINLAIHQK